MTLPSRNHTIEWMLRDWYGPDRAEAEIAAKLNKPKPIADSIDDAVKSILSPSRLKILKVKDEWESIAGKVNAAHTNPAFFKENILFVEIAHPAFRMALDNPRMKAVILEKIRDQFGENFCSDIKYVPAGRRG